jgi:excisionase family DNA binding protein
VTTGDVAEAPGASRKGRDVRRRDDWLRWENLPDILTVSEASEFLRIPKNGVYEAIRLGVIPAMNAGVRRTRISRTALQKVFGLPVEGTKTAAFGHVLEANK